MNRSRTTDIYFADARSKLIDLAAFMDRIDRSVGSDDYRIHSFRVALGELESGKPERTKRILKLLSDPTMDPILHATPGPASGAWQGFDSSDVS